MTNKNLVLTAMIFAVAMMFIDQTIVALAVPDLNQDLKLSPTGAQWVVNGYLLSLAALFALGGRVADVVGHRKTLIIGVFSFMLFSALCGATPTGSAGQTWIIACRVLQGASAAFLFPAALAIVVSSFEVSERGKALAVFFSISGGLTAVGPIAGGYLTQWTWRAIFWINVPIALIAIGLTIISKPEQQPRKERDRLGRGGPVGRRHGARRARAPAGLGVGLVECGDVGVHRRRTPADRRVRALGAARRPAAGADAAVRQPRLRRRQRGAVPALDLLRAAVLLRQPLRPDRARRERLQRRADHPGVLRRLHDRRPVGRPDPRRPGRSSDGRARLCRLRGRVLPVGEQAPQRCRSPASGRGWRSPAPAWDWCSARSRPTR